MRQFRGKMHYFNKVAAGGENDNEEDDVGNDIDTESEIDESDVEAVYEPGPFDGVLDEDDDDDNEVEETNEAAQQGTAQQHMIHLVGGTGSINLQTIVNNVVDNVIALTQNTNENGEVNIAAYRRLDTSSARLNNSGSQNETRTYDDQDLLRDNNSTHGNEEAGSSSSTVVPAVRRPTAPTRIVHRINISATHGDRQVTADAQLITSVHSDGTTTDEPCTPVDITITSTRNDTEQILSEQTLRDAEFSRKNISIRNRKRHHSDSSDSSDDDSNDDVESEESNESDESDHESSEEEVKVTANGSQCEINVTVKKIRRDIVNDIDDPTAAGEDNSNIARQIVNRTQAILASDTTAKEFECHAHCQDDLENSDSSASSCKNDDLCEDRNKNENYCNPMVSDSEEEIDHDVILRGDRIGNTTYSERHVLKLLMRWVQELPSYTSPNSKDMDDEGAEDKALEVSFEEEMSLLWDMSAEADVMSYLVDKDVFTLIRDTLERSGCKRLTEVALGIMANLLSQKSIVEDFHVHDAKLKLVSKVILLVGKVSNVAVLIQIFAVLKRIVWFIKNVKIVDEWVGLFLSGQFLHCANFMMVSSTNLLLLGDVITTLYTLLETLCADNLMQNKEREDKDEVGEENEEDQSMVPKDQINSSENYLPFCETNFVSSLCEGLNELLKNPKPKRSTNTAFTGEKTGERDDGFEIDIPIPDNHVQTAILNGLGSLTYLKRTGSGQNVLIENKEKIITFILHFHRKFGLCTESQTNSDSIEYFALSLSLLGFCHKHLPAVSQEALLIPVSAASKLITREESVEEDREKLVIRMNTGLHFDAITYIALVVHNYISLVSTTFNEDAVNKIRQLEKYQKFFRIVDKMVETVSHASEGDVPGATNDREYGNIREQTVGNE